MMLAAADVHSQHSIDTGVNRRGWLVPTWPNISSSLLLFMSTFCTQVCKQQEALHKESQNLPACAEIRDACAVSKSLLAQFVLAMTQ